MLNKIIYILASGTILAMSIFGFVGAHAYAQASSPAVNPSGQACEALGTASGDNACGSQAGTNVDNVIKLAINVLSLIVGVASVIMIIVGGFKYVLSQGESSNTASAKNTIIYAIVGLVVVALAQVIVKFVLNKSVAVTSCKPGTSLHNGKCA